MSTQIQKAKKQDQDKDIQIIAAGITGALVGAGVGIVAAVALRDEKTKKKTVDALYNFKDYLWDYLKTNYNKTNNPVYKEIKKLKAKAENK